MEQALSIMCVAAQREPNQVRRYGTNYGAFQNTLATVTPVFVPYIVMKPVKGTGKQRSHLCLVSSLITFKSKMPKECIHNDHINI